MNINQWQPVITDPAQTKLILQKLESIRDSLLHKKNPNISSDLLIGESGCILFFLYYYKLTNDPRNLAIAEEMIVGIFQKFQEKPEEQKLTFAAGLAGMCWLIEFINAKKIFEIDTQSIFAEVEPHLEAYMLSEMEQGNYDYMHGALGVGLFFLQKDDSSKYAGHITALIDMLYAKSIENVNDGTVRWNYWLKGIETTCLGLSHGIPSILVFLSKCWDKGIRSEKNVALMNGITKYLLSNMQDPSIYNSYFSYTVNTKEHTPHSTRLAWCYGDLGVCSALWQSNKILKNETVDKIVIDVMQFSTHRISLIENMVDDAGLCHGAAGIAHIFNHFYQQTRIPEFKDSALYWFEETLKMAKYEDGLAGYKTCASHHNMEYINSEALLDGVTGIGLALISAISDIEPVWDECLLLS